MDPYSDPLAFAAIHRARSALAGITTDAGTRAKSAAFVEAAFTMLAADNTASGRHAMKSHPNALVQKAAAHALLDAELGESLAPLAAAYLRTISESSLLDAMLRYGTAIPPGARSAMVASGAVGNIVAEGNPIPVKRLSVALGDVEPATAVGLVVMSRQMLEVGGPAVLAMFERELMSAVTKACNIAVLDAAVLPSNTIAIEGTGDPLADLRTGLQAAEPSEGYVVAAPHGDVAVLATLPEAGPAFTVRGGEFRPGIHVVAVDDATDLIVIPASRFALFDGGMTIRSAEGAAIDMRDDPQSPAESVSLFQCSLRALLVERHWHIAQAADVVVIERGSGS